MTPGLIKLSFFCVDIFFVMIVMVLIILRRTAWIKSVSYDRTIYAFSAIILVLTAFIFKVGNMGLLIGYLAIGFILAWAHRKYFKDDPTPTKISQRNTELVIVITWLPALLVFIGISLLAYCWDVLKRLSVKSC
jgi:hypothetical protein